MTAEQIEKAIEKIRPERGDIDGWIVVEYKDLEIIRNTIGKLVDENENLKYWLNDVIFDENNIDVELPARYLRKLGYIDFDDKKKVYINKHNNSPFMQEDSKEKAFYLKDEELNEYTQQLESQNDDYKSRIDKAIEIYQNRNSVNIKKKRFMEDKNTSDLMYEMLQGSDENE